MVTSRKGSSGLFVLVVLVLVAALAVEGFILLRPKPKRPAEAEAAIKSGSNQIVTFGGKSAPIKIELYAPLTLEWHKKTIGLLKEYDKTHPGQVFVTLMPMGRSDCDEAMQKRGHKCAVIFINGKEEFKLPSGQEVTLEQRPNADGSTYNSQDVITIIEGLVKGK